MSQSWNASAVLPTLNTAYISGIEAQLLLGAEQKTPFTRMLMSVARGLGAPAHISSAEDKVFQVTQGCFLFRRGDKVFRAAAGDCVFVSRGETNSFSAQSDGGGRLTLVSTPAKHEQFFLAMSRLPTPHDVTEVLRTCHRHGQVIVGPVVQE